MKFNVVPGRRSEKKERRDHGGRREYDEKKSHARGNLRF